MLLLVQCAVAALLAVAIMHRWPQVSALSAVASSLAGVLLVRAAIVANNFWLASHFLSDPPAAAAPLPAMLRMVFNELHATLVSSSWHMPFCRLGARPEIHGSDLPVLLVHGYGCNSGYWQPLARALRAAGVSFHAVDLEPVFGDIDGYLPQVSRAIDVLRTATGAPQVVLVTHSMGGLVARAWLRDNGWHHVAKLIALGTPHQGTGLAKFAIGKNAQQMCRTGRVADAAGSAWLARLNATPHQERSRIVSLYSIHDNIIAPPTSSRLEGGCNIAFACVGHVALASHPAVIAEVIEQIRKARNSGAGGGGAGAGAGAGSENAGCADESGLWYWRRQATARR